MMIFFKSQFSNPVLTSRIFYESRICFSPYDSKSFINISPAAHFRFNINQANRVGKASLNIAKSKFYTKVSIVYELFLGRGSLYCEEF